MDDTEEKIFEMFSEHTGLKDYEVNREIMLKDISGHELFVIDVEDEFDIEFTDNQLGDILTLGQLIDAVEEMTA